MSKATEKNLHINTDMRVIPYYITVRTQIALLSGVIYFRAVLFQLAGCYYCTVVIGEKFISAQSVNQPHASITSVGSV